MALEAYNRKRDFKKTSEPKGQAAPRARRSKGLRFVVQEHHASRLHFDLRLEMGGVLKSWAVPKGPSLNPADKRLAVQTEDHPLKYIDFEGHIPEGNYGAGDMAVWDTGTYTLFDPKKDPEKAAADGSLHLCFNGKTLRGEFKLFRMRQDDQWLLVKADDEFADRNWQIENKISSDKPKAKSGRKPANRKKAARPAADEPAPGGLAGSVKSRMPQKLSPMLATLVDKPPASDDWLYEVKWDGYRLECFIRNGEVRLVSRNHNDLTALFPGVAAKLADLGVENAIIDGEIVALDEHGLPSFQLLQNSTNIRYGVRQRKGLANPSTEAPIVFYAFDLPYLNGVDLTRTPLLERKALLEPIIKAAKTTELRFSDHFAGRKAGEALYAHAGKEGLEGVIAKHRDSHYLQRRSDQWLKIKLQHQMDVVIAGYTAPRRSRSHFGALILGVYEKGELIYVGHAGTGFNSAGLQELFSLMQPLRRKTCPFAKVPPTNEPAQWLKPMLVCEVKFGEMTADQRLRHPVYMGLRHDKEPTECRWEKRENVATLAQHAEAEVKQENSGAKAAATKVISNRSSKLKPTSADVSLLLEPKLRGDLTVQAGDHTVKLTNLDKVYWPNDGITKGDLLRYYYQVSGALLPYLKNRPLILKRYPGGVDEQFFFQHDVKDPPPFVRILPHREKGETVHYAICDNLATLLYLVNLGTITQNAWHSRVETLSKPDWLVFDLDPGEVPYSAVCELALIIQQTLSKLKLKCYAKTSGSEGMHVYLPVKPVYEYDQLRDFGILIAEYICRQHPDLATTARMLKKRGKNLIYLDVMQNNEGKTVATPWAVRSKPGAPVSTPLSWAEVKRVPDPKDFTIENVLKNLKRRDAYFAPVLEKPQRIERALGLLEKLIGSSKQPS